MPYNEGLHKENDIVFAFDGRKVSQLGLKEKYAMREIFGPLEDEESVRCELIDGFNKADMYITYKGMRKNISIKTGRASTIHQEDVYGFIKFLEDLGISQDSRDTFLLLFWRDGTLDGSNPKIKKNLMDLLNEYGEKIKNFNLELNSDKNIVKKVIHRILFGGTDNQPISAEYIYLPEIENGLIVSENQIFHHVDRRDWEYIDNPHIGPLQFRPHLLSAKEEGKEKYLKRVDFWWANFHSDMQFIFRYYKRRF